MLYALIAIAAVIVIFILIVATRPSQFQIARSAKMAAPAPIVFTQVNDFRNWDAWSPWAKLDPNMTATREGPPAGTGAVYKWSGNGKVGEGMMTITDSRPSDSVRLKLQFMRPFKCTNQTEFTFQPQGDQTVVNWVMTGQNNFVCKAFGLFINMDKMIGRDFEKGLAQMKAVSESVASQ
ncbi:MAG: SRPBCC family protein [Burkholderiales bacterium]|nr:SRPBCC family protein [Phycisphaerae bacterium]